MSSYLLGATTLTLFFFLVLSLNAKSLCSSRGLKRNFTHLTRFLLQPPRGKRTFTSTTICSWPIKPYRLQIKLKGGIVPHNERGSLSLLGMTFTLIISLLFVLFTQQRLLHFQQIKQRAQLYLCGKKALKETSHFIRQTEKDNTWIERLHTFIEHARFVPELNKTVAAAKVAKKFLQHKQDAQYFSYLKKITHKKFCSFKQVVSFVKSPYKRRLLFKRNRKGATQLRGNTWRFYIPGKQLNTIITGHYNLEKGQKKASPQKVKERSVAFF